MIEKINPSAVENIAKAADRLQEVAEIYDSSVDRSKKRITSKDKYLHIDVKALLEEIAPEAVLSRSSIHMDSTARRLRILYGISAAVVRAAKVLRLHTVRARNGQARATEPYSTEAILS